MSPTHQQINILTFLMFFFAIRKKDKVTSIVLYTKEHFIALAVHFIQLDEKTPTSQVLTIFRGETSEPDTFAKP